MRQLLKARFAKLVILSLLAGLVPAVAAPTAAQASTCNGTSARAYVRDWSTGVPVEYWTGTFTYQDLSPTGNGFVPRWPSTPNRVDTIIMGPYGYLEFGGDNISNTVKDGGGVVMPLLFTQGLPFDFAPGSRMWADSSCGVVPGGSSGYPPNLPDPFNTVKIATTYHYALLNPYAPRGIYTVYARGVCAAHVPGRSCASIDHPVVRIDYRNFGPNQNPDAHLFLWF